jgi:hypothetical protein
MHRTGSRPIRRAFWGAFALPLLVVGSAAGGRGDQGVRHATKTHQAEQPAPETRLRVVSCDTLMLSIPHGLDRIVAKAKFVNRGPVGGGEIDFIAGWPNSPRTLQVFRIPAYLFGDMFWEPRRNLVTEWVAGVRPVVDVFHVANGRAALVFSHGSNGGFEYWDDAIVRNNAALGPDGRYHYTTSDIWRWNGTEYKLIATLPYRQRVEALAKLPHGVGD